MKRLALIAVLVSLPAAALASSMSFDLKQFNDPVTQATMRFQACMATKLGMNGVQQLMKDGQALNQQIIARCKAGDLHGARELAVNFSQTPAGQASLACGQSMQGQLQQLSKSANLGMYADMVRDFGNGQVPADVCVGINGPQTTTQ